jgi:hypothetical protein
LLLLASETKIVSILDRKFFDLHSEFGDKLWNFLFLEGQNLTIERMIFERFCLKFLGVSQIFADNHRGTRCSLAFFPHFDIYHIFDTGSSLFKFLIFVRPAILQVFQTIEGLLQHVEFQIAYRIVKKQKPNELSMF